MQIIIRQICILLIGITTGTLLANHDSKPFALMLAPAGDARLAGRTIGDQFERGIALPFAHYIAKKIHAEIDPITIVYSHLPGESVSPLQQANFANRLGIDLYISLSFYQEEQTKPRIGLYRFNNSSMTMPKPPALSFVPFDQAYTINESKTASALHFLYQKLNSQEYAHKLLLVGQCAIPFKPLLGISAPAIGIEIGIKDNLSWQEYADIIATQLIALINTMNR